MLRGVRAIGQGVVSGGFARGIGAVGAVGVAVLAPLGMAAQTGLQVGGVPALNYDADEGFGYGVVAALYQYGAGEVRPYQWSLHPTVFLTTEGRRDFTLFFDAPEFHGRWRFDAFAGSRQQIATPYYGLGNDSEFDEAITSTSVSRTEPVEREPVRYQAAS